MIEYIKESFEELKNNVSWPSWSQGQSLTVLVALFSIIFSLAIWGVDTVFARVVKHILIGLNKTLHSWQSKRKIKNGMLSVQ